MKLINIWIISYTKKMYKIIHTMNQKENVCCGYTADME